MPAYSAALFSPPAPVSKVTLRNLARGDVVSNVSMLLDTGADVTLIPRGFVSQLGVQIYSEEAYELMGFDGNRSVVQAVTLDLIFLSRTFRGRYLLIDQEWGILGRDILNHLSLSFDGPQLTWNESRVAQT